MKIDTWAWGTNRKKPQRKANTTLHGQVTSLPCMTLRPVPEAQADKAPTIQKAPVDSSDFRPCSTGRVGCTSKRTVFTFISVKCLGRDKV